MASKGHPKPLHGAKKYDKVKLACTVADCDNEFYVAYFENFKGTAKRQCAEHFGKKAKRKPPTQFVPITVDKLIGLMYS